MGEVRGPVRALAPARRQPPLIRSLVHPDLLIYLHAPVAKLQANIRKRNRSYEQSIPDEYLHNIQEAYTQYIRQHNIRTLFVDVSHADFLGNEAHLRVVIDAMESGVEKDQQYFTLP